jgi:Ti-type conjugative transfer relaxase TraA
MKTGSACMQGFSMAIYHLSAQILSRKAGRSAVAAAAYRASENLYDEHVGKTFDYTRKGGVEYSEILAPPESPSWVYDRQSLWNAVEKIENRKDAQLAREIEIGLPVELSQEQQVALLRAFAKDTFVSQGMVADVALHLDNEKNPHAHVMLTTRSISPDGFGLKRRDWNARTELLSWREGWANTANEHLARAGLDIRIDHRTLEAQGIDLVPGRKLGLSAERQQHLNLPYNLVERVVEQREIAVENGQRIIEDPALALRGLTHTQATFTDRDIARYLHTRTDGAEQFQSAFLKVTTSEELVTLGKDERGQKRLTTREMVNIEREMLERAERLAGAGTHTVSTAHQDQVLADGRLSTQQRKAFDHVAGKRDLAVLVGIAGSGKSTMLESARRAWEAAGYSVKGAALAGIAAENLENASGITARTLASWERSWEKGYDQLGKRDVLVIDEAGLVGTRQLARVLQSAEQAGAKVVLVGDPEQLQAIEAGAPFRGIAAQAGVVELTEVWRQKLAWQKEATQQLAAGHTDEAVKAYGREGLIQAAPTRDEARKALLAAWQAGREQPKESQLMLAYTRADVRQLNEEARAFRQATGEIGNGELIETERGPREFAAGDRLYFTRNERSLDVRNGSLGTVERIHDGMLQVRLDGETSRRVVVDSKQYPHLEHGYAATIHKTQGTTVDRTYVLATPHFDRHSTYVALSRHRENVMMFYGRDDFSPEWSKATPANNLMATLSRARTKELAHDYLDRDQVGDLHPVGSSERVAEQRATRPATVTAAERLRQHLDEVARRLADKREQERTAAAAIEQQRAQVHEHYPAVERETIKQRERDLNKDYDHGLEL